MVSPKEVGGNKFSYDKILEDKNLPEYWHRKYQLTLARWRKFYGLRARNKVNPMLEMLVERAAVLHTKMQYYESPDFSTHTGLQIENPLYMGKYDAMLKTILKTAEQIQKYTEAVPKATSKNLNLKLEATVKELKKLNDGELDNELRALVGGSKAQVVATVIGEEEEESDSE